MQPLQVSNSLKASEQFILPFSFIITSFFALVIFSVTLVISPTAFHPDVVRMPTGLSLAHLFILGWATMLAMGAIYQLIAVVTQNSIYSIRLGFIHYGLYSIGVFGLFMTLSNFNLPGMISFGTMAVAGVLVFLFNVFITVRLSKLNNPVLTATKSALFYLGATVLTGILMVLNFRFAIIGSLHSSILIIHLWVGLIGWFLFLIIGYSFKMLPMFYLSHGQSEKLQKWVIYILHSSIFASAVAALIGMSTALLPISLGLVSIALWLFIFHVRQIQSKRFKKKPGNGIAFFVYLVYFFTGIATIAFALSIINSKLLLSMPFLSTLLFIYLFGFIHLSILAYLSKIIPFLWWTFRYGKDVGKTETPSLASMLDEGIIAKKLLFHFITIILFIGGLVLAQPVIGIITAFLFAFSILYYLVSIVKVFTY